MHFLNLSNAVVISSLILKTYALPLRSRPLDQDERHQIQQRGSYSVVAVDGSSATTTSNSPSPIIETVTQTLKDTKTITASPTYPPTAKETLITTKVVTESSPDNVITPSSTTITRTTESASTYTSVPLSTTSAYLVVNPDGTTAPALVTSQTTSYLPTLSSTSLRKPSQPSFSSLITPTVALPTATRTFSQTNNTSWYQSLPTTTSTSYDNGLWHTFYPRPSNASFIVSTSTRASTGLSSPLQSAAL